MSIASLKAAVKTRWDAAGLDTAIAELRPANIGLSGRNATAGIATPTGRRAVGGAAPESAMPRAEYIVFVARLVEETRGSRTYCQVVRFQVWSGGSATTDGYVDAIYNAFHNSHKAGTDPLAMSTGTVCDVCAEPGSVFKQDDNVFQGVQEIEVEYTRANTTPS